MVSKGTDGEDAEGRGWGLAQSHDRGNSSSVTQQVSPIWWGDYCFNGNEEKSSFEVWSGSGLGTEVGAKNRVWTQARTGLRLVGSQEEEASKLRGICLVKKRGTQVPGSEKLAEWNWFQKVTQKTGT